MQRLGGIWAQICSYENLYLAYFKASQGKRSRDDVAEYCLHLEDELYSLHEELQSNTWLPGGYRKFTIYERKPRLISCAPFRDRVVHHALMNSIEPWLDKSMIYHSYACRKNKGVHRALDYYQHKARSYAYVVHVDIKAYFPSIVHANLKACIRHYIKDVYALRALDAIIDSVPGDKGLPIGNLTSQVLANLYLNQTDHYWQQKSGGYMRYVDDMFIFADDKNELWQWRDKLTDMLAALGLQLHPAKQQLHRTFEKVNVLGYQLTGRKRWLRNDNGHRFRRRLRGMQLAYAKGESSWEDYRPSIASWIGHAKHGETEGLRKAIFTQAFLTYEEKGNQLP